MKSERTFLIIFAMLVLISAVTLMLSNINPNFSITGFVAEGRLPTIGGDSGNWGSVLNTYLTQEHTAEGGHKNVTIQGSLNVTGNITDSSGGLLNVPSGMVSFFKLSACPSGWTQDNETVGRYIVGINESGTLNLTVGTALNDSENRAVGNHTHGITDPTHSHVLGIRNEENSGGTLPEQSGPGVASANAVTSSEETGITINSTGNVSGTNAPYIQYLVCIKN